MFELLVSFAWETTHMSIRLIESKRVSQGSVRGTMVSIALHATVITLAVYATANAGEVIVKIPADAVRVFYPQLPREAPHSPSQPTRRTLPRDPERVPGLPRSPLTLSSTVASEFPPVETSTTIIDDRGLFGNSSVNERASFGPGSSGSVPDSYFASQVEKPALPRGGNPRPQYPSLLEGSRTAGIVLAQFVVDTLGRADMSTFTVLESSNDLFSASLRNALSHWRFFPAESGGHRVRQIVQLPLKFIAPKHSNECGHVCS